MSRTITRQGFRLAAISDVEKRNCNIRYNVTTLRTVRWLLGYVGFVIPVHTACIKLVIRNLSSYYIGDED